MENKVKKYCNEHALLEKGMGIVAGISGGADSIALLRFLCDIKEELALRIYAVHVHHGIREEDADRDLSYVRMLCREWGVPLFAFRLDIPDIAAKKHLSLEEAGRLERYARFEEIRQVTESDRIAVAHHKDDLAETVLMNLLRGSGLRGLGGTRPIRDRVIRPFLCIEKKEICSWLQKREIEWRTDETNADTAYLRNRIRNCLLPELTAHYNEQAVSHLVGIAGDCCEADEYLQKEAARLLEEALPKEDGIKEMITRSLLSPAVTLKEEILNGKEHIIKVYLIREALKRIDCGLRDITRTHIEQILGLTEKKGSGMLHLPGGIRVTHAYQRLRFEKENEKRKQPDFFIKISVFPRDKSKKVPQNSCVNWFDYDRIEKNVVLRQRKSTDRIVTLANGTGKRLKDYLIDAQMPAEVRDVWPVVASGQEILWIPGYRMAESCKVREETQLILEVELCFTKEQGAFS